MSFRKERKFRLTSYDAKILRARLLGDEMKLLHPDRRIESQYFDTPDLRMFDESEEGTLPRKKVRVRWYNDDQSVLNLERKISSIEGRYKTTKQVTSDEFKVFLAKGLIDANYGVVKPSVRISYLRSYFSYKQLRITFDREIKYKFMAGNRQLRDFEEVVEIKAPIHISEDYLETIVASPTSRFSKYGRAFLFHRNMI